MEMPLEKVVYMENAVDDGLGPVMNCNIFNDLLEFQMQNNPALAGKTKRDIAEACFMSESTLKNLCNGKNDNPRIGTLKRILRYIGGGSVDRLIGFAPPRDFAKEEAQYDASLVEAMQIRLDEKRERIDELTTQLAAVETDRDRLRKMVLEKGECLSAARTKIEHLQALVDDNASSRRQSDKQSGELRDDFEKVRSTLYAERAETRKLRITLAAMCVIAFVALAGIIYLLWDVTNPVAGIFRY